MDARVFMYSVVAILDQSRVKCASYDNNVFYDLIKALFCS